MWADTPANIDRELVKKIKFYFNAVYKLPFINRFPVRSLRDSW